MQEPGWTARYRVPRATLTRVVRSGAFRHARDRARLLVDDAPGLRSLAADVQRLHNAVAPLELLGEQMIAAERFLLERAAELDHGAGPWTSEHDGPHTSLPADPHAAVLARRRVLVAGLIYLVTTDDLVPDFKTGGYVDDALLLSWVMGLCAAELAPFMDDDALDGS